MINQESKPNSSAPYVGDQKPPARVLTRISVAAGVSLVTIAAFAIGVPWGCYRYNHVVLSQAVVRGTVTKVGARIDGRIKSIEVEVGQHVSKGDVLLRMEDRHSLAALERARGELQSAIKDLESEKMGIEQTKRRLSLDIDRVNAGRKKATGDLAALQSTLTRVEKQYDITVNLIKTGAAPANDIIRITGDRDKALAMVSAGNAVLEAADFNYQKAMNELDGVHVREIRLGVLESQIAVARAKVELAEADLESAVITAPETGRVLDRIVETGGSAKVGEPMISLWVGRAWVEAWADERDLGKIKIGNLVDVSLDASPQRKLPGRVEGIGLASDKQLQPSSVPSTLHAFVRQNAMVPVRIVLEEDASRIQLGLSVMVGIRKQSESAHSSVAQSAPAGNNRSGLTKVTVKE